jgi:hypothetical protein
MIRQSVNCCARLSTVLIVFALGGAPERSDAKTIQVQCQVPGRNIAKALDIAHAGDVISVRGVCTEQVTITTDHTTLDGNGTAIIRGSGMAIQVFNPMVGIYGA